jgi:hypothetical protein
MNSLIRRRGEWDAYFSLHAYGNGWLLPWGYTHDRLDDYYDLEYNALIGADGIRNFSGRLFFIF